MTLSQPPKQNDRVRVLLVDDEVRILTVLGRVLSVTHDVATARNGREALQLLKEDDDYDVVITDLSMPLLGGWGLYSHICQSHPHLKDRVVFSSAAPGPVRLREIQRVGNVFLQKPVDPAQLLNTIQYLVDAA